MWASQTESQGPESHLRASDHRSRVEDFYVEGPLELVWSFDPGSELLELHVFVSSWSLCLAVSRASIGRLAWAGV